MNNRIRLQAVVVRASRILMARLFQDGLTWWCLPGGGQEPGETPDEGVLRELSEECNVHGRIVRKLGHMFFANGDEAITFFIDIGNQEPSLGIEPEAIKLGVASPLVDVKFLGLTEIPERDRAFLWAAGLLGVEGFTQLVESWGDDVSYPDRS